MSQPKILIIDDDKELCEIIALYLTKKGFDCFQACNGNTTLVQWLAYHPALLILNTQLSIINGVETLRALRQKTDISILFLSNYGEAPSLDINSDDYIIKPFSLAALLSRVEGILRSRGLLEMPVTYKQFLDFPGLKIDIVNSQVMVEDKEIYLTQMEFQSLVKLASNPGWTFTAEELFPFILDRNTADLLAASLQINHMRQKLEQNTVKHEYIITVWGKGYKFNDQL